MPSERALTRSEKRKLVTDPESEPPAKRKKQKPVNARPPPPDFELSASEEDSRPSSGSFIKLDTGSRATGTGNKSNRFAALDIDVCGESEQTVSRKKGSGPRGSLGPITRKDAEVPSRASEQPNGKVRPKKQVPLVTLNARRLPKSGLKPSEIRDVLALCCTRVGATMPWVMIRHYPLIRNVIVFEVPGLCWADFHPNPTSRLTGVPYPLSRFSRPNVNTSVAFLHDASQLSKHRNFKYRNLARIYPFALPYEPPLNRSGGLRDTLREILCVPGNVRKAAPGARGKAPRLLPLEECVLTADARLAMGYRPMIEPMDLGVPTDVVAMDCEMCDTAGAISTLTRCSIVDVHGKVLLDEMCRTETPITDYITHITGMSSKTFENVTTSKEDVTEKVSSLLKGKIVVGHGLANDLEALGIEHSWVIDTLELYQRIPAHSGYRPKLSHLSYRYLRRTIQDCGPRCLSNGGHELSSGHDSVEDAQAAMQLLQHFRSLNVTSDTLLDLLPNTKITLINSTSQNRAWLGNRHDAVEVAEPSAFVSALSGAVGNTKEDEKRITYARWTFPPLKFDEALSSIYEMVPIGTTSIVLSTPGPDFFEGRKERIREIKQHNEQEEHEAVAKKELALRNAVEQARMGVALIWSKQTPEND